MTVKRRLFLSNLLMILVPVIVTVMIGILCVSFLWFSLQRGTGLWFEDSEEFTYASMAVSETIEHYLDKGEDLSAAETVLHNGGMELTVLRDGKTFFQYGELEEGDDKLLEAAKVLQNEAKIEQDGRSLYVHEKNSDGHNYVICLFGGNNNGQNYHDFKISVLVSIILIIITILLSIILTNKFLIKFVFKKIEEPIDILRYGVRQIRDGNLEYRIDCERSDEFLPVCEDFNEMAVRLRESVEAVQQQEKNRKELIAGISHDIRSPLTSIQAYIEGLIDDIAKTPEKRKTYLYTIKNKAEDLERILSQLFLFSKMDLGEYPEHPCEIYLDDEIRKIVSDASEEFSEKGMTITEDLEHVEIYADPVQIQRIIINIMENSLKYKDKDEGRIDIKLRYTEDGCLLTIAVDGPGVPEQSIEHLFEVFYRSDSSRHNPERGSGLGLAIVANAVEHMGGKVWAENRNEEGLEIFIKIPTGGNENGKDTDN